MPPTTALTPRFFFSFSPTSSRFESVFVEDHTPALGPDLHLLGDEHHLLLKDLMHRRIFDDAERTRRRELRRDDVADARRKLGGPRLCLAHLPLGELPDGEAVPLFEARLVSLHLVDERLVLGVHRERLLVQRPGRANVARELGLPREGELARDAEIARLGRTRQGPSIRVVERHRFARELERHPPLHVAALRERARLARGLLHLRGLVEDWR
jgi:hypothetical protein